MSHILFSGRGLVGGIASGPALPCQKPLSISRINAYTGKLEDPDHDLNGASLAGTVLLFPEGGGSSSGSYVLMNLSERGLAPAAMVVHKPDAVVTAGAYVSGIPLIGGVDLEDIKTVPAGCLLWVSGFSGRISFR